MGSFPETYDDLNGFDYFNVPLVSYDRCSCSPPRTGTSI